MISPKIFWGTFFVAVIVGSPVLTDESWQNAQGVVQLAMFGLFVALVFPPVIAFMWHETKKLLKDL